MSRTEPERVLSPLFTWRSAIAESSLASTTKLIAYALSLHMSERGDSCFPSMPRIAAEAGSDETTARRHVKILIDYGWLVKTQGGGRGRPNRYTARIPANFPRHTYFEAKEGGAPGFAEETPAESPGYPETPAESPQTPAGDPINPGTVPGEDVSSATREREGVRQNELEEEPKPTAPALKAREWKAKLPELWRAMWERVGDSAEPVRFVLPRGLKVDVYGKAASDRNRRRIVLFRDDPIDTTISGALTDAAKKWDREVQVFFTECLEKGGKQKRGEWKFGAFYGYPSFFHTAIIER